MTHLPPFLSSPVLQDTWLPEQVAFVEAMGNATGNAFWEATLPPSVARPAEADMAALRTFITNKYVNKLYCPRDYPEPPTIENYQTHPVSVHPIRI